MAKRTSKRSARRKGETFQGCRKRLMKQKKYKKPGAASKACAGPKGKKRKATKRKRRRTRR